MDISDSITIIDWSGLNTLIEKVGMDICIMDSITITDWNGRNTYERGVFVGKVGILLSISSS
jgi:hypothetical protein